MLIFIVYHNGFVLDPHLNPTKSVCILFIILLAYFIYCRANWTVAPSQSFSLLLYVNHNSSLPHLHNFNAEIVTRFIDFQSWFVLPCGRERPRSFSQLIFSESHYSRTRSSFISSVLFRSQIILYFLTRLTSST